MAEKVFNFFTMQINLTKFTLQVPFFTGDDTPAETTPEARARRERNMEMLRGYVMNGIQTIASKYQ